MNNADKKLAALEHNCLARLRSNMMDDIHADDGSHDGRGERTVFDMDDVLDTSHTAGEYLYTMQSEGFIHDIHDALELLLESYYTDDEAAEIASELDY